MSISTSTLQGSLPSQLLSHLWWGPGVSDNPINVIQALSHNLSDSKHPTSLQYF